MLPAVVVDKSVLQMLTHEQLDVMRHAFDLVCVPTLTREIIGDLRRAPGGSQRSTAEQRVQDLARRMSRMHLTTPVTWRKLVLENLYGKSVPMNGQIPIDTGARNVTASADGSKLIYDATLEQELWRRWARGDFSVSDQEKAQLWRDEIDALDIAKFNKGWAKFEKETIGPIRGVDEAIARVDDLLRSRDPKALSAILAALFALLRILPPDDVTMAVGHAAERGCPFVRYAPYAASVVRILLVFVAASRAMLVPQRETNLIDLQYLFYAPFGFGFASNDALHQRLWPAVTSNSVFMTGTELQADLAARAEWRAQFEQLNDEEKQRHYTEYAHYPIELPGSPINAVWNIGYVPREQFIADLRARRPMSEVEDEIGPELKKMIDEMDALREQKPEDAGEWPLGPRPGYEKPSF
jgi:hypothetical protein